MALAIDRDHFAAAEYARFSDRLRDNLAALKRVLGWEGFGAGPPSLGAELELAIVDREGTALPINQALLARVSDRRLQPELDRFNVEANLSPVLAAGRPFSALEAEMRQILRKTDAAANALGGRIVPIGILPTLREPDLGPSALTDLPRYRALSAEVRRTRGSPFAIRIDGTEPLSITSSDIALEGANTSFQIHLRVPPADFAAVYNAAQIATGPAVAIGANSPVFLGHRLWDETRIALFKQALDQRDLTGAMWHPPARVSFGHGWVRKDAIELFAESVALFPPIFPVRGPEVLNDDLEGGPPPRLDELRLHQGTVWRWNRAIYDPDSGGHLRIEFRALPAGPTTIDMAASAAFLLGLTMALSRKIEQVIPALPFAHAEYNFYRAAQHGLDAHFLWPLSEKLSPREVPALELLPALVPMAEYGLALLDVDECETRRLMDVIRGRLETRTTGARWQRRTLERLGYQQGENAPLREMLGQYIDHVHEGKPVHEW